MGNQAKITHIDMPTHHLLSRICLLGLITIFACSFAPVSAGVSLEVIGGSWIAPQTDVPCVLPHGMARLWFPLSAKTALGGGCEILQNEIGNTPVYAPMIAFRYSKKLHRRWALDIVAASGAEFLNDTVYPMLSPSTGMRFFISPRWQLGASIGWSKIFGNSERSNLIISSASIEYRFGFRDRDHDWVLDRTDKCKNTPRHTIVDRHGCALDRDGDGVFDGLDVCPDTPLAALVDSLGCPMDSDSDGVYDGVDRCPETPVEILVDITGCPRDTDRDGVPDYADSCADTPEGAIVNHSGCPMDSDEDGILDGIDQCEGTPTGFEVDLFGCPRIPSIEGEIVYNLFDDALEITSFALNHLQRVVRRIRAYPHRKTLIEVYTDTEGSPTYNKNRARTVGAKIVHFLEQEGIDPEMVEIIPMGENNPVKNGLTQKAKQKNRRAVLKTVD